MNEIFPDKLNGRAIRRYFSIVKCIYYALGWGVPLELHLTLLTYTLAYIL